ncbi:hypothetical protein [Edaphobacter albus]|uniref:hypothetical protein n=1 Tax=Edaphobacter sp. 4G125 TaxID=2763071 RepID=UPI00164778A9|nr:hypothetical protein [Edaphobacter sp. 4G125]QNI37649.1 hypothetical protein H7846_05000 [Edaphobacter sp. 4G125]
MTRSLLSIALAAAVVSPLPTMQDKKVDTATQAPTTSANRKEMTGDDVFRANCQRCHMPPMSISQRTTGTVLMHMRTRARLSREDELKLLHFMAP